MTVEIRSEIIEDNPHRGTGTNAVYKLIITSKGTFEEMEFVRNKMMSFSKDA